MRATQQLGLSVCPSSQYSLGSVTLTELNCNIQGSALLPHKVASAEQHSCAHSRDLVPSQPPPEAAEPHPSALPGWQEVAVGFSGGVGMTPQPLQGTVMSSPVSVSPVGPVAVRHALEVPSGATG